MRTSALFGALHDQLQAGLFVDPHLYHWIHHLKLQSNPEDRFDRHANQAFSVHYDTTIHFCSHSLLLRRADTASANQVSFRRACTLACVVTHSAAAQQAAWSDEMGVGWSVGG